MTLPEGAQRGWQGGWVSVTHVYPSALAQSFWTALIAFGANLMVTVAVSLCTTAKSEGELQGFVHGLTKARTKPGIWWMEPERLAVVVLVAAVVVCMLVAR